jgi:hypothetical protein
MAQFNENNQLTRDTFPNLQDLTTILYDDQFNRVLNIVKNRILAAHNNIIVAPVINNGVAPIGAPVINNGVARLHNNDFINIPMQVITDVKNFLRNQKGYTIMDSEDMNGNIIGWRINLPA